MTRREDREGKIALWLEHLRRWKGSSESLSSYAKSHGIERWTMYHWRKVLRREGRWQEAPEERPGHGSRRGAAAPDFTREPVRFARVKLEQNAPVCSLTIRVMFTNGRRAEIDLGDTQSLREVLDCLEHSA